MTESLPDGLLGDITAAQLAAFPHMEAANAMQARVIELLQEADDADSGLSADARAIKRRTAEEMRPLIAEQNAAAWRHMDALKARYPDHIS